MPPSISYSACGFEQLGAGKGAKSSLTNFDRSGRARPVDAVTRDTPTMTASPTPLRYGAVPNPCNGQRPVVCSKEERLLLMASSYGKADVRPGQRVAPIDLYTGAMFKSLQTWLPKLERTRIIILSAKHGLVGKEWPKIAPYGSRPLTPRKAQRLIENGINCRLDDWGRLRTDKCRS